MLERVVFRTSTSLYSDLSVPFMLTNSLCASSEDREMSTAFCRSSCGSRSSRYFSIGLSVENTILSLIMFSGSASSHDKASVRRYVKNSSKVCPAVLEESQNWYLENTIRFYPANSFSNFVFTWSNFFVVFVFAPLEGVVLLQCFGANSRQQHGNFGRIGFLRFFFSDEIQFESLYPSSPIFGGVPLKRKIFRKLEILLHFGCFSHYMTPCNKRHEHVESMFNNLTTRPGLVTYACWPGYTCESRKIIIFVFVKVSPLAG